MKNKPNFYTEDKRWDKRLKWNKYIHDYHEVEDLK